MYYYDKAQHEYHETIHNFVDNITYYERLINETKLQITEDHLTLINNTYYQFWNFRNGQGLRDAYYRKLEER